MANKQEFMNELNSILATAKSLNIHAVEIISSDLHNRTILTYPNPTQNKAMPNCCNAMQEVAQQYTHDIRNITPSGQSTTLNIKYYL